MKSEKLRERKQKLDNQFWRDRLHNIFEDARPPEDYDQGYYKKFYSELSKAMHRDIADNFRSLEPENKKKFIVLLWRLARHDPEEWSDQDQRDRRDLYKETADFLDKYFRWEEEDTVGWVF